MAANCLCKVTVHSCSPFAFQLRSPAPAAAMAATATAIAAAAGPGPGSPATEMGSPFCSAAKRFVEG